MVEEIHSDVNFNTTINPRSSLGKRTDLEPPADDKTWGEFLCRGEKLLSIFHAGDKDAGQYLTPPQDSVASKLTNFPGLFEKWGYRIFNHEKTDLGEYYYGLTDVFKDLKVSRRTEDWKFWRATHGDLRPGSQPLDEQKYVVDGQEYRATGANFVMPMNKKNGVIIIAGQYSPDHKAKERTPPVTVLPDLKRSSDIFWGLWNTEAGLQSPVKHIITWGATNKLTQAAIARALKNTNNFRIPDWPGVEFATDKEEGKAILGTPNGVGVGYFLAQHKYPLGNLKVKSVRVFLADSLIFMERVPPMIYWELAPAYPAF